MKTMIFLSPLVFGLAHLHHFYEFRITHPQVPLLAAVARSFLQLIYTSLFGAYATFVFLRTGSLLGIIAVHTFCNAMGLPRLGGFVEPYWLLSQDRSPKQIVLTMVYYVLLLGGTAAWWRNLYPLTESPLKLANF
jgi:prenyl protein peptidase